MKTLPNGIQVMRLHRLSGDGPLKAFADIAIAEQILIKGFRVIEGKNGLTIGWPSKEGPNGKFHFTVQPLSKEIEEVIADAISEAYKS